MHAFKTTAIVAAFAGASFALAISADAATLTGSGLLLDNGSGYQKVSGPMDVQPGSAVIVNPDGDGVIRYADGCDVRVRPGEVYIIRDVSPCEAGLNQTQSSGLGEYGLVLGGVAVGGIVIGAIALSGGGSDKPKSP